MHIDLNSCFATVEQQANPLLRGKPIVVAAYASPKGCILASSVEAKRFGIKTGMSVKEGKLRYPKLIVLSPDPWKYRSVHLRLRKLLSSYTPFVQPRSIDEFVLDLTNTPSLKTKSMQEVGLEIKVRIKKEIGDFLTVSIGISTNRFLAKLASNLQKPDGLIEINGQNFKKHYATIKPTDLPYIKQRNAFRLASVGIFTVIDFYNSPLWKLKVAFASINSYYWHMRLRGYEVDAVSWGRRSYGNSYALPQPLATVKELMPILTKLTTKMMGRVRSAGYKARGVHLSLFYRDGSFWHKGESFSHFLFDTRDILKIFRSLLTTSYLVGQKPKPIRNIAVSCFNLTKTKLIQLSFFEDINSKVLLNSHVDSANKKWGEFVVIPASMMATAQYVPDRIAFGGVKELEEFTLGA